MIHEKKHVMIPKYQQKPIFFKTYIHYIISTYIYIYIYMQPTPLPTRSQPGWVTSPPPFHGGVDRPMIRPENDRP